MLVISKDPYMSSRCLLFQRLTVILSDSIYYYSIYLWAHHLQPQNTSRTLLLLLNSGLLIVDSIHFQYNGMLIGLLLLSILYMHQKHYLKSAILFAVLLNFKHIFLYFVSLIQAPAYFFYLLKNYCMKSSTLKIYRLTVLGCTVLLIFTVSLLPFLSSLPSVMSRLFPFGRGLTHAYWAPNVWAIYNGVDLALSVLLKGKSNTEYTKGMVGLYNHEVLPNITPGISLMCAVGACLGIGYVIWKNKGISFNWCCVMSCWSFYMFGWHVHEKAVLMYWIPLVLIEQMDRSRVWEVSTIACYSLLPLIYTPIEQPVLICIYIISTYLSYCILKPSLSILHKIYLSISGILYLFYLFYNNIRGEETFLPLMLISLFTSFLQLYTYIRVLQVPIILSKPNHIL